MSLRDNIVMQGHASNRTDAGGQKFRLEDSMDMAVYKFSLDEEYSQKLDNMAREAGVSVQDFIRSKLFSLTTSFTPVEAVDRALQKYQKGEQFTLPQIYDEDWTIKRGVAGTFGKAFFNYVAEECSDKIRFVGMTNHGRHAQYEIV